MSLTFLVFAIFANIACNFAQEAPTLPESPIPQGELVPPFKDQNLCAFMNLGGGSSGPMPFVCWTCGLPIKQKYCGRETSYDYKCCPGFAKSPLVDNQCGEVESVWKLLHEHLNDYAVPKFASLLKSTANIPDLFDQKGTGVYTIFVPHTDEAMKTGNFDLTTASGFPHPIRLHIARDRVYSRELTNGKLIKTEFGDTKLKVTTYSNGLIFIDCRMLVNPDHEARNGVIHYIASPLVPHKKKTILQVLQSEPQTNAFYGDLPSEIRQLLDQDSESEWYTVFAPSNSAWREAKDKYGSKVDEVVKNHIIKRMICAQAITQKAKSLGPSMTNEYLGVDCNYDKSRSVIDSCGTPSKIIQEDLVAGNGVVQVIDKVLVPLSAMPIKEAISSISTGFPKLPVSKFQQALAGCDLKMNTYSRYVMLVPVDEAFDWLQSDSKFSEQYNSASDKCNVLRYHLLKLNKKTADFSQQEMLQTNYDASGSSPAVSVNYIKYRYGSRLFFNYARAVQLEPKQFSQGYIYFIDKVLVPPTMTMMEILSKRPDTSIVYDKLKETGFSSTLNRFGPKVIFLACQNHGWSTRDEKNYGSSEMTRLLQLHTIKVPLWGDDIGQFHRETFSTVEAVLQDGGKPMQLRIRRELNGNIYIGYDELKFDLWSLVIESNLHAVDGMIWVVDWPLRFKS